MKITFNYSKTYQAFEGFGASGAWWAQHIGGWTEIDEESGLEKRDRISQLLFDKEKGIGLRTYRYNLGGGSAQSGKGDYPEILRRAECFLNNGKLDFSKDKNAVYMMKQAVKDGADEVILFVNSPPEDYTKNGMAQLGKYQIFRTNLAKKNYGKFADYCISVTEHFVKEGLPVKYISPINEPLWIWNGKQEGCHYSPRQAGLVMKCFAEKLIKNGNLKNVKLSGVENGDIRWFNKVYTREMLKYSEVRQLVDSVDIHSYFTQLPLPHFINDRPAFLKRYNKWMKKNYPDIHVKMSEWTHMQGGRDYGMTSALVTAKTICEDITLLNVTSWQHWLACSPYDFCDGLIYFNMDKQNFELTKRYYVTGNFSKFIPFGATRFDITTDNKDVSAVGFIKDNVIVTVFVNLSDIDEHFSANSNGEVYITNEKRNLEKISVNKKDKVIVPKKSVVTFVVEKVL